MQTLRYSPRFNKHRLKESKNTVKIRNVKRYVILKTSHSGVVQEQMIFKIKILNYNRSTIEIKINTCVVLYNFFTFTL